MKELFNKNILLGISGSIAAYKSLELIQQLKKKGAIVRVVMTKSAQAFVTPLSLKIISGHQVFIDSDFLYNKMIDHIKISKWPDIIVLAPATANLLAKLSSGITNDLLSAICLATSSPIAISPVMNKNMYLAPSTQDNLKKLNNRGVIFWGPDYGNQICGDKGFGRMIKISKLVKLITNYFKSGFNNVKNLKIMVTAGPTIELIDPVRFISNYSSGKMGFAIVKAAIDVGYQVTLISGPVKISTPDGIFKKINIKSAIEMKDAVMSLVKNQDIFICCAAITDYRLEKISRKKIKKQKNNKLCLKLVKNPDIISEVASLKKNRPYIVGFSADTEKIGKYAKEKRIKKNIDLICANDVSKPNQGFNSNYNALHLFWKTGSMMLSINNKLSLAKKLLHQIIIFYEKKS
ncbi:dfp [Wigglesworthia glossinidia endosymbiont of Glossina brevipalpis]|uniref:Coenzyme A biosynthesis bifunctional protein CoaBC n=1 Tax=Wigglesworthia glossinidia brevipalpis TaxID=36870 RepID=Q8D2F2_WIGBR|nr:dfp [Wigglesworthia glossinidia endosymbiont of Glossina brevipalpis]